VLVVLEMHKVVRQRPPMALILFLVLLHLRAVVVLELLLANRVVLVVAVMLVVVLLVAQGHLDKVMLVVRGMLVVQYTEAVAVVVLVLWEWLFRLAYLEGMVVLV
jgi:hypothetical protein